MYALPNACIQTLPPSYHETRLKTKPGYTFAVRYLPNGNIDLIKCRTGSWSAVNLPKVK